MIARLNPVQATAALVALAAAVSAQYSVPAAQVDIASVEAQWQASGLDAPIQGGQSLNEALEAQGLLQAQYNSTVIVPGQPYPASDVTAQPVLTIYPGANSSLSTSNSYTLALVDFSSISDPDPQGEYRHYLANGVSMVTLGNGALHIHDGNRITDYASPGPLPGTGPHRYAWLMFQEGANFKAPANLSTTGVAPGHWDFKAYVAETGLGAPVLASFFTVENGAPTVAAAATSAVNTATLAVSSASAPASSAAAATTSSSSGSGVAAAAGASSSSSTGAASSVFAPAAGVLAAVAGLVTLLA